jgi:hypothetical protein
MSLPRVHTLPEANEAHVAACVAGGPNSPEPGDTLVVRAAWAVLEPERGRYDDDAFAGLRRAVLAARRAGLEPLVVAHDGALPDWQIARGGWLDRDALAGWGCYVERLASTLGEALRAWVPIDGLLDEALAYDADARRVARLLLDAHAAAYLHLRRGPGFGGRPAAVGIFEPWTDDGAAPPFARRWIRAAAGLGPAPPGPTDADALVRVLASGRIAPPFAAFGELPNGTPALDFVGIRWRGGVDAAVARAVALWGHRLPVGFVSAAVVAGEALGEDDAARLCDTIAARGVRLRWRP